MSTSYDGLCIWINDQYRYAFRNKIIVDEFTAVTIRDLHKKTFDAPNEYWYNVNSSNTETTGDRRGCVNGGTCIRAVVPSSDGKSYHTSNRLYISWNGGDTERRVFPVYTLIINARMGVVNSVTWDDGCYFCTDDLTIAESSDPSAGKCVHTVVSNDTVVDRTSRKTPEAGKMCWWSDDGTNKMDLKVYVAWTGTDSTGRAFSSAGERFSRYKPYAWMNFIPPRDGMKLLTDSALNPLGR
jgi:hypothetical protein